MSIQDLPFPRLELRWKQPDKEPDDYGFYKYICEYLLVIAPPDKLDIRSNEGSDYGVRNIENVLNTTTCTTGNANHIVYEDGWLETPFRDSVHIVRDSKILNLPAFVTYGDLYRELKEMDDIRKR